MLCVCFLMVDANVYGCTSGQSFRMGMLRNILHLFWQSPKGGKEMLINLNYVEKFLLLNE